MQKRQILPTGSSAGSSVVIFLLLVLLGIFCWRATAAPPQLGLRTVDVGENLIVSSVYPAGLAWVGGIRPGDKVIALDEQRVEPGKRYLAVESASSITVHSKNHGNLRVSTDISLADRTMTMRIIVTIIAVSFALTGCITYAFVGHRTPAINLMLVFMISAAVSSNFSIVVPYGFAWALAGIVVSNILFTSSTLLFFLSFAINRLKLRFGRILGGISVGGGALLLGSYAWVVFNNTAGYVLLRPFLFLFFLLNIFGACGLILLSFVQAKPYGERVQVAVGSISLAVLGGCLPFCGLTLVPALLTDYILSPYYTSPLLIFVPIGIGFAMVGYYHPYIATALRNILTTLLVSSVLVISLTAVFTMLDLPLIGMVIVSAIVFGLLYPYLHRTVCQIFFGTTGSALPLTIYRNTMVKQAYFFAFSPFLIVLIPGLQVRLWAAALAVSGLVLTIRHLYQDQTRMWENGVRAGLQTARDRAALLASATEPCAETPETAADHSE